MTRIDPDLMADVAVESRMQAFADRLRDVPVEALVNELRRVPTEDLVVELRRRGILIGSCEVDNFERIRA